MVLFHSCPSYELKSFYTEQLSWISSVVNREVQEQEAQVKCLILPRTVLRLMS